jgi:uncharacterized protein (TIGR02996 family)
MHLSPHPQELAFLQAVVENPDDETSLLVLADWLEEKGEPRRAELLRLHLCLRETCCEPQRHPERAAQQARVVQLLMEGVRPCVAQRVVEVGNGVPMTFAWVPPGSFLMGSPPDEEERSGDETQHKVTLTRGFYLGIHPLTQAQWRAVMGSNPSHFRGDDRPVEQMSWDDCQGFCARLGQATGKTFRLPTEAEWEYACRAGTTTPFSFGATLSTEQANYDGNYTYGKGKKGVCQKQTTPVGSCPGNAWGLCEMHGNVWEWCQDWYGPYRAGDVTDPQGSNNGDARVLRGGSWGDFPRWCRSANRGGGAPGYRHFLIGCRLVLCLD